MTFFPCPKWAVAQKAAAFFSLEMTCVCLGTYPPEKGYPCWQAMRQIQAFPRV